MPPSSGGAVRFASEDNERPGGRTVRRTTSSWNLRIRFWLPALIVFMLLACVPPPHWAMAQGDRESRQIDLSINYSGRFVYVYVPPGLVAMPELRAALQQSLGCTLPDTSFSSTSGAYRTEWLPDLFRWHGLTEEVQVRTAPLVRLAEKYNLDWVTISFAPYVERTNTIEPSDYAVRSSKGDSTYFAIPIGRSESAPDSYRCSSGFRSAQLIMALVAMTTPTAVALLLLLRMHYVIKHRSSNDLGNSLFGYARFISNVVLCMWAGTAWWFSLVGGSLVGDIVGGGHSEIGYAVGAISVWIFPFLGQLAISAFFVPAAISTPRRRMVPQRPCPAVCVGLGLYRSPCDLYLNDDGRGDQP